MTPTHDLLVSRAALRDSKLVAGEIAPIGEGEALLKVAAFSITANNVTYGVFGEAMKYWNFFPAPQGFGRVPVWGFATVVESKAQGVAPGQRVYGYLPMSSHLKVSPQRVKPAGFADGAAHRRDLPAAYQAYTFTDRDPLYRPDTEALQMLFRPLFITSFLIDDYLVDENLFGAKQVIFSSASAKTAYAAARLLAARGIDVVGLTSARNVAFTEGLGVYKRVVAYDDLEKLNADAAAAFVDIAGDAAVRGRVHRHLRNALKLSLQVGATHWARGAASADPLPGPQPRFFFAPDRIVKRVADWGGEAFSARTADAFANFLPVAAASTHVVTGHGLQAAAKAFVAQVDGTADPRDGHVIALD